jgi:hypothetical protein
MNREDREWLTMQTAIKNRMLQELYPTLTLSQIFDHLRGSSGRVEPTKPASKEQVESVVVVNNASSRVDQPNYDSIKTAEEELELFRDAVLVSKHESAIYGSKGKLISVIFKHFKLLSF